MEENMEEKNKQDSNQSLIGKPVIVLANQDASSSVGSLGSVGFIKGITFLSVIFADFM